MNSCLTCSKECKRIYCNQKCYSKSPKLKEQAKNSVLIKSNSEKKWHTGHKHSAKTKSKISKNTPKKIGISNPKWKGDNVSYDALHDWVRRHKEFSGKCEICGLKSDNKRIIQAANISGEYKRNINDFVWLCNKCHSRFDALKNFKSYEVVGVECKSNGYLDKTEKEKCKWLLENQVFSKILIAKKKKVGRRVEVEYKEFKNI